MNGDFKTSTITFTMCQQQTVVEIAVDGKSWYQSLSMYCSILIRKGECKLIFRVPNFILPHLKSDYICLIYSASLFTLLI